ncbi:glycosyltransferase [Thiocapsa bogorovii]|uniref:glycosyltransferase n=1 Tax=Thiocapsa bogorovii TaxID=521689 RepID=UPI001E2B8DA9|nr:glycosyltransferase [Thiocapsa bogorovii]UHD17122.1 glycosyltransferase [Thiocapsa bogorovii]
MRKLYFLYSTFEEFPNDRVDLTELFSSGIADRGHRIDWHMHPAEISDGGVRQVGVNERVFLCAKKPSSSVRARWENSLSRLGHTLSLIGLIKQNPYDFVQVRDQILGALIAVIGCALARRPFVFWMSFRYVEADLFKARDNTLGLSLAKRIMLFIRGYVSAQVLYRVILPRAHHIFVQSDRMEDDLAERGVARSKMTPVPMGVKWSKIGGSEVAPADEAWLQDRLVIVYVGTLVKARRLDFLVEVLDFVRVECPTVLLVLVGDGSISDMSFIERVIETRGVQDYVHFTGHVQMEKAWSLIKAAKLGLSPLRPSPMLDAGSPTKVMEYLALGCPVVANDQPDQSKVVRESGAGLIVPYDVRRFADAVVTLLKSPADAERMGQLGPDYVRRHRSYEAMTPLLEAKYLELFGCPEGAPRPDGSIG